MSMAMALMTSLLSFSADPNGQNDAGESCLAASGGFSANLNLSLSTAAMALRLTRHMTLRFSVSSAGDVNGDGFDDIIIGANVPIPTVVAGESYVVFGSRRIQCQPQPLGSQRQWLLINGINYR